MKSNVDFINCTLNELLNDKGFDCDCGKIHKVSVKEIVMEQGGLSKIADIVKKYKGTRPFIISDKNTFNAAGKAVYSFLDKGKVPFTGFIFQEEEPVPDECSVGKVVMNFDPACDLIIGIGSGTINDIGKIIAKITGLEYIIVCTAPSMDGFASSTSSMVLDGIKVSLPSTCPIAIIADTNILCNAPLKLLQAGFGDMLAKYISICEWRIAHLVKGEYYCENVADLIRHSLKRCVESVEELKKRSQKAIVNLMQGLVMCGIAMSFAGVSRPASGIEHYFSHIWDMRGLMLNRHCELHGIQVGIGTLLSIRIYDYIRNVTPDKEKALNYVNNFEYSEYEEFLRSFLKQAGENLILLEKKEGKYDNQKHTKRLDIIVEKWREIKKIIKEELPDYFQLRELMQIIGAPCTPKEISISDCEVKDTFIATKDIRDKYIASSLLWDLGLIDEASSAL
jgi:glycerol-1-phosphate dehydrogenase [NAD(P)+]